MYSSIVLLNTMLIIMLQIPIYAYVTKFIGDMNALLLAYISCFLFYIPLYWEKGSTGSIFLFVIGITYLEMFFTTALDSIIIRYSHKQSKYYFIAFNFLFAIDISLSSWIIHSEKWLLPSLSTLLILLSISLYRLSSKRKNYS
ncbi:hypothetical protein [Avibacterium sp. 21-599]|uniref:hypothetical protein n=1 Tax=Avibacterium sp. 21-599 TaxID=2911528 RepID=UPI0022483B0E|nr:hypothetical protein [Avibacterium sp. 21-599]MCW9718316.1 hypothetical protein [Avibacterium sp. 21-599]